MPLLGYSNVSLKAIKKNLGASVWSLGAVGMGQGRFIYRLKSKVISLKLPEILKSRIVSKQCVGFLKVCMEKCL